MTRILIVADQRDFRATISASLQKRGFLVSEAADSRKAISTFTREAPEIALLDYDALGKKCLEVATQMLTIRSSTRLIVLAAPIDDLADMERIGVDILLRKPLTLKRLVESSTALSKMKPPLNIVAR